LCVRTRLPHTLEPRINAWVFRNVRIRWSRAGCMFDPAMIVVSPEVPDVVPENIMLLWFSPVH
jgi:hypothetical protein